MNDDWSVWHHAPPHVFVPNTVYFVTGSTLNKRHFFPNDEHLAIMQRSLFESAARFDWGLRAWALMSNHNHIIAKAPDDARTLTAMIRKFHADSARRINKLDRMAGRQVWFQYRDTCLTFEDSYLARLNYVLQNPVRHKLVSVATQYPFCSASWFAKNTTETFQRKVATFKTDKVNVPDDFNPAWRGEE